MCDLCRHMTRGPERPGKGRNAHLSWGSSPSLARGGGKGVRHAQQDLPMLSKWEETLFPLAEKKKKSEPRPKEKGKCYIQ